MVSVRLVRDPHRFVPSGAPFNFDPRVNPVLCNVAVAFARGEPGFADVVFAPDDARVRKFRAEMHGVDVVHVRLRPVNWVAEVVVPDVARMASPGVLDCDLDAVAAAVRALAM